MSQQKPLLVANMHQIIDIDNHLTKYITRGDVYIKCSLGQKTMKTKNISKNGVIDEKATFEYGGEQMLQCEVLKRKDQRRVGVVQISLQYIPNQNEAQPRGFRILNSTRKQVASLGLTLFKISRTALAAEGSSILNANIGRGNNSSRRPSTNVYANFTVNPIVTNSVSSKKFPTEKYVQLRAVIGNISEKEADEMLVNFNGNVESCVNYFFATGHKPVPQINAAQNVPALPSTRSAPVLPTRRNDNSNNNTNPRRRASSVEKFSPALRNTLRSVVGDILTDQQANQLLDKAGGDVERAINYYFANPEKFKENTATSFVKPVLPRASVIARPVVPVAPAQSFLNNNVKYPVRGQNHVSPPLVSGTYVDANVARGQTVVQAQPVVGATAPVNAYNNNAYNMMYSGNAMVNNRGSVYNNQGMMGMTNNNMVGSMNNVYQQSTGVANYNNRYGSGVGVNNNTPMYRQSITQPVYSNYNNYGAAPGISGRR
jgi:hypothetical protein